MNQFGGNWTKAKIEILIEYASAYLTIMKRYPFFELYYFDGFAGSGSIVDGKRTGVEITVGAAARIIALENPKSFDVYYFVEKDPKNHALLKERTEEAFPDKQIHTVCEDCNKKLVDMANFMKKAKNKNVRTLAYIDPYGMQVEWKSLESLKGLNIDMWILVPTGLGVNRLLKKNGDISNAWLERLEKFLGLGREEIESFFYSKKKTSTLFDAEITLVQKNDNAVNRSAELYRNRLKTIFDHVSKPYELTNKSKSVMYHLFLASNNEAGVRIANDIVKKYNS